MKFQLHRVCNIKVVVLSIEIFSFSLERLGLFLVKALLITQRY